MSDRKAFTADALKSLPLPITHSNFSVSERLLATDRRLISGASMKVIIDGVEYVPKATTEQPVRQPHDLLCLYDLLYRLREGINSLRGALQLQKDVDELDQLASMANQAIGILIRRLS